MLAIVLLSVLLHYLCLLGLSRLMPGLRIPDPLKILVGVVGALIAHVVEVGLFAIAGGLVLGAVFVVLFARAAPE